MKPTRTKNQRFDTTQRQLDEEVSRSDAHLARKKLQSAIHRLEDQGYHNQFDYKNYGVQYNPIYDKETGRVKTLEESGLTPEEYANLATNMATAPEMTTEWNEERARKIGGEIFNSIASKDALSRFVDKQKFIQLYIDAVKQYHMNDEDFNYEIIKSLYNEAGGHLSTGGSDFSSGLEGMLPYEPK